MAKINKLDRLTVINARAAGKLSDGAGLYLEVLKSGSKSWRMKYFYGEVEKRITLGRFDEKNSLIHVSIAQARQKAEAARQSLRDGIDPLAERKVAKTAAPAQIVTFKEMALELIETKKNKTSESNWTNFKRSLELHVFPTFGDVDITSIDAMQVIEVGRNAQKTGKYTGTRIVQRIGEVLSYSILTGRRSGANPVQKGIYAFMSPFQREHYERITFAELPEFLRDLDTSRSFEITKLLEKFLLLSGVRTGEARDLRAGWVDFDKKIIKFPADQHKVGKKLKNAGKESFDYIIPMTPLLSALVDTAIKMVSAGANDYVFPQYRNFKLQASDNAVTYAIKTRAGGKWAGRMVGHGYRGLLSTHLEEAGYSDKLISIQTGHIYGTSTQRSYQKTEVIEQRREMMSWYESECVKAGLII